MAEKPQLGGQAAERGRTKSRPGRNRVLGRSRGKQSFCFGKTREYHVMSGSTFTGRFQHQLRGNAVIAVTLLMPGLEINSDELPLLPLVETLDSK